MKKYFSCLFLATSLLFSFHINAQYNWQWGRSITSPDSIKNGLGECNAVAVDHFGHVFAGGLSIATIGALGSYTFVNPDTFVALNGSVAFIAKYDTLGNIKWARFYPVDFGSLTGIATDEAGNVYFTGTFLTNQIIFGTDTLRNTFNQLSVFVVKMDSTGNPVWARSLDSTGNNARVALDRSGNVFLTGNFGGSELIIGPDTLVNRNPFLLRKDVFLAKMDNAGNFLWGKDIGGIDSFGWDNESNALAVDSAGSVFVCGSVAGHVAYFDTVVDTISTVLNFVNIYAAKFSPSGHFIWVNIPSVVVAGTEASNVANSIIVDNSDNCYLSGSFITEYLTFGGDTVSNPHEGDEEIFLAKLNSSGRPTWLRNFGGGDRDFGWALAFDTSSLFFWLTCNPWSHQLVFDADTIITDTTFGTFTSDNVCFVKFDSTGHEKYVNSLPCGGDDQNGIVVDAVGNLYFCSEYGSGPPGGTAQYHVGPDTFQTIYAITSPCENFFVAKLSPYSRQTGHDSANVDSNEAVQNFRSPEYDVNVYPNPSNQQFTVTYDGYLKEIAHLYLYDVTGQLLDTYLMEENTLTISDAKLPTGVYFVKVIIDGAINIRKLEIY